MVCLNDFLAVKMDGATVFHGSNLDVLPYMADNSVDSIVTDPPYELGFMGKKWDSTGIAYSVELWAECMRVLKPGGHLLAFSGSRTYHRMVVAIEDAGFEIRDMISWISNKTFPKSLDISKAIDKQAGVEREQEKQLNNPAGNKSGGNSYNMSVTGMPDSVAETLPTTDEAKQWAGWGTALKPTVEPIVMARKPLIGTVAENVLKYGTGGLNIDGSRIGSETVTINTFDNGAKPFGDAVGEPFTSRQSMGRWPANIILDEYAAELLDEQSGISKGQIGMKRINGGKQIFDTGGRNDTQSFKTGIVDEGGASRFFYVAKASKKDRNEGIDDKANFHPTVKPTDLMRYLIKLVTPEGGTVLDPFTGSGSTGKAAILDGYQFIGIELTDEYLPIIEGRLKWANTQRQLTVDKEQEKLF